MVKQREEAAHLGRDGCSRLLGLARLKAAPCNIVLQLRFSSDMRNDDFAKNHNDISNMPRPFFSHLVSLNIGRSAPGNSLMFGASAARCFFGNSVSKKYERLTPLSKKLSSGSGSFYI